MAETREIKYINKNFNDYRNQLIEFAKNYFPDTYNDFSPASPGMMFIEMASYVGDVLSFYQDIQLQETFVQYAKNPENLYSLAYMLGYRPKQTGVSEVELEVSMDLPAINTSGANYEPNFLYAATIAENASVKATTQGQPKFLIDKQIDFSYSSSLDPSDITVKSVLNGNPSEYTIKKKVKAFSAEIKLQEFQITGPEKFRTLTIDDDDIVGVLSIIDSSGHEYYEVPYLGQETIFEEEANTDGDSDKVPNKIILRKVPRRFVSRFNSQGQLVLQFGAGVSSDDDSTIVPNPKNVGIGNSEGVRRIDHTYDPSNFLFTRTYGLAPSNTTLFVRYLKGGGVKANVPAGTITQQDSVTTSAVYTQYLNTVAFTNPTPATGGKDKDSVEEIRQNSLRAYNEQGRAVTVQDYNVRAQSLPSKFGTVAKTFVTQDEATQNETGGLVNSNPFALSLYVLAYDSAGRLVNATTNLKQNLKKYLSEYMMITDVLNIKDAFVVNIGINYEILALPNYSGRQVLLDCSNKLKEYFDTSNRQINQPINLATINTLLDQVTGVQTVQKVEIVNKVGGLYSAFSYDVKGATRNNVVYPSYDPCIFEVKYPDADIKGRITTV